MKRIKASLHKLRRRQSPDESAPSRITNETVAEHRERILAGGRRFKYPVQYARVRLIRNTVIITLLLIVTLAGLIWWQLYPAQTTNTFFYRVTQILPLPVARIDGENASYSYYLLTLRSAMHFLETNANVNFDTDDGKRQLSYLKRTALDDAVQYAYATKLAREKGITVSNKEVDDFINKIREQNRVSVNQTAFETSIYRFYGWDYDEFKASTRAKLLKNKVLRQVDTAAQQKATSLLAQLKAGADFTQLAKTQSDDVGADQTGGDQGDVTKDSQDPNGLVTAADALQPNQTSDIIAGTDGYYLIKLLSKSGTQVHFARIFVAYKQFTSQIETFKKQGAVQEYISVPTDTGPIQQR